MGRLWFCALPLWLCAAALSAEDTEQWLAGGSARNWVQEGWQVILATEGCEAGELWIFRSGGELEVLSCEDGEISKTRQTWSVKKSEGEDDLVVIGGREWELEKLRGKPSSDSGLPPGETRISVLRRRRSSQSESVLEYKLVQRSLTGGL